MRFRKTIAVCLVFCVLITTGIISSLAASNGITVYADAVNADAGQTFTVPIKISGNTGLSAIGLNLTYDKDKITPVSVKKGAVLTSGMTDNSIGVGDTASFNILWFSTKNVTADGVIFNVEFLANSNASGTTALNIEIDEDNTFSANYSTPNISANDVIISIKGTGEHYTMPQVTEPIVSNMKMSFYSDTTFGIFNREAEIPVKVKNNTGLMGFKLDLIYDSNAIEILNVSNTPLTENGSLYFNDKTGVLSLIWNSSEEFNSDGIILLVTVKYKKAIKTDISVICSQENTFDSSYESLDVACKNINIGIHRMGDANLDGKVSITDVTAIQRHLAELEDLKNNGVLVADCDEYSGLGISDATRIQMALAEYFTLD